MELKYYHIWATLLLHITITYACRKSTTVPTTTTITTTTSTEPATAKLLKNTKISYDDDSTTPFQTSSTTTAVATTEANPLIRKDNRCGSAFLLSDGSSAQCDPHGDLFCCSKWGFCGFTSEHCECSDCIDYRTSYSINTTEVTTQKSNNNQVVRSDGRCGSSVPLSDGRPAQCDPETEFYCCSKWGYCGDTDGHCDCADCVNYRNLDVIDDEAFNSKDTSEDDSGPHTEYNEYDGDVHTSLKSGEDVEEEENSGTVRSSLEIMTIKSTSERNTETTVDEEEEIRTPIRIHNRFLGSKSTTEKTTEKDAKQLRQSHKIDLKSRHRSSDKSFECSDTEEWCKYEPNCDKEDVQTKCPKFCKICKECKDLESWCKYEPKCDTDDVTQKCPKWCGTCGGIMQNEKESRTTLEDLDFDYDHSDDTYSDGCEKRVQKWSGWRGGLDGKIVVKRKVDPAMPTWSLVMGLDMDVKRLWSEDISTDKMNNRTFKLRPAYSWNSEVQEDEEKTINVHVRWDEEGSIPKIRTLLINGLSFECNGDGDYDISSSDKTPRRIRVRPNVQKNKDNDQVKNSETSSSETKLVTPEMKIRDPTKIKRIRLPGKSRSSVKSSMKVSFSSKISSTDDPDEDDEADTKVKDTKLAIQKVGGERGIFARWPKKVMGFYVLLSDDTEKGYESDRDWHPKLHPYMQTGANVLFFTFIHPETMEVPPAFANLAKTRGTDAEGAVPKDTVILFALGGYAYSVKVNPWPWLTSKEAAEEMAERVAEWPEKYGCDGIDLDIEDGAGDAKGAGKNMIHFVRKLKELQPKMIIGQPTYGYPAIHAEIDVINASWDAKGNNNNLTDTIGLMVYEGTNAINYVKNYVSGTKQWQGFPIKVNAPSNVILLGTKGKTSAATINKLVKEAIRKDYLGVMVWYASVINGLQYAKGSWDASTSESAQEAYVNGMNRFREEMEKS